MCRMVIRTGRIHPKKAQRNKQILFLAIILIIAGLGFATTDAYQLINGNFFN